MLTVYRFMQNPSFVRMQLLGQVLAASVVVVEAASVVVVAALVVLGASVVTGSVGATQVRYPSGEHGPHLAHASELHMHLSDHPLACPLHQPSHFAMGCGSHSAQPVQAPELQAHLAPPRGVIALAPPIAAVRRNHWRGQHAGNHDDHELRDHHLRGVGHLLALICGTTRRADVSERCSVRRTGAAQERAREAAEDEAEKAALVAAQTAVQQAEATARGRYGILCASETRGLSGL